MLKSPTHQTKPSPLQPPASGNALAATRGFGLGDGRKQAPRAAPDVSAAPPAHDFSRVAVSSPARRGAGQGPVSSVVQRVIKVKEADADLAALKQGKSDAHQAVLQNWADSETVHDFSAEDELHGAAASAAAQPDEASALYGAANLKFLTKADGRLPTLYFKSGANSGRLRQQHGGGPKASSEANKTDYFFASQAHLNAFHAAAKKAKKDDVAFEPDAAVHHFSTVPTDDHYHHEVTYDQDRKVKKTHASGGKVVTNVADYDADKVKSIYKKVTGRAK
jgi:hypothetical protein